MTQSTAKVATPFASRYLQQLCKHFAHKIPATFSSTEGRIEFEDNTCLLKADGDVLDIRIEAVDAAALERLQGVVVRHLERFAFRDNPAVRWTAG